MNIGKIVWVKIEKEMSNKQIQLENLGLSLINNYVFTRISDSVWDPINDSIVLPIFISNIKLNHEYW